MASEHPKIVVRLLPPEITEDELAASIGEGHLSAVIWRSFVAGKRSKGEAKPAQNSRCYLQFSSTDKAEAFIKDYHGHHFVDARGENFRAVVCYAPYQKVPKAKSGKDNRENTIEDDPVYLEFLEKQAKPKEFVAPASAKDDLRPADPGNTPLLQHMRKVMAEKERARAEKRDSSWKKWVEEPKRPKYRCSACGTSRHLEEDPDDRGTFYCTRCWEAFEAEVAAPSAKSSKSSKKKAKAAAAAAAEAEEEWGEEDETESGSRKKKKKKKKAGYEESEEWWSSSKADDGWGSSSWQAGSSAGYGTEESASSSKKSKKKKKEKADAYEEDAYWKPVAEKDPGGWEDANTEKESGSRSGKKKKAEASHWAEADSGWAEADSKSGGQKGSKVAAETWWESSGYGGGRSGGDNRESGRDGRWRAKK